MIVKVSGGKYRKKYIFTGRYRKTPKEKGHAK
jgi:hypothetical protein